MAKEKNTSRKNGKMIGRVFVILIVGVAAVWFTIATEKREAANAERALLTEEENTDWTDVSTNSSTESQSLTDVVTNPLMAEIPVEYKGMTVSFNPSLHVPNWVSWELTAEETQGTSPRHNKFLQDASVDGCPLPSDYSNSGYTRGHMAPAGDMKWDSEAMKETFYMTNITPQAQSLNTGAWKNLEEKCRLWAQADGRLIIICGPVLTDSLEETIGESGVAVPRRFFKVILSPDARPVRGIGFVMNNGHVPGGMQKAAVSIREVERLTGHDFFSILPDSLEEVVENSNDFPYWSTIR